ncbi:MAG: methyltransferase domain-containing protein, partial [Gammaproteobacteria bacterium]
MLLIRHSDTRGFVSDMSRSAQVPTSPPATLLIRHWRNLDTAPQDGPVLDLACGSGQNGLWLAHQGYSVDFADRSDEALTDVRRALEQADQPFTRTICDRITPRHPDLAKRHRLLQVDLESGLTPILPASHYAAILVFRYLHRPLIPQIIQALQPGGVLIYETFTRDQARYGRPRNPDFLLEAGEVLRWMPDIEPIFYWEG